MSFLGLSGHQPPNAPDPPRDPDAETVGLPPELGDDTPLGRLVRFLIAAVLGGVAAMVPFFFLSGATDIGQGFARGLSTARSMVNRIEGAAVPVSLGLGFVAGSCAAVWGDRFLAPIFRHLRGSRWPRI